MEVKSFLLIILLSALSIAISAQEGIVMKLSLNDIYELADKNNHSLKESLLANKYSKEAVNIARSERLPKIEASLNGSYIGNQVLLSRNFSDSQDFSTPHLGNSFSLDFSLPVYSGGRISENIMLKKLQSQLSLITHESNRQEIRFRLTDWYLYLFRLRNEKIIYQGNKEQSEILYNEIQVKYEQGTVLKSDVTRYQLRLKDIELELESVIDQISIINYQLTIVLGLPTHTDIIPDIDFVKNELELTHLQSYRDTIPIKSYQIKSAQKDIEIAQRQKKLIGAERLPSVILWASESLKGPITTAMPPINKNLNTWQVGIGLKFTISSLYTSNKKMALQEFSIKQSQERLKEAIDKEQIETNTTYTQLFQSLAQLEVRKKYKELADENYEVVSNRYLNGLAIITEILDAGNQQLEAELKLINKQAEIYYYYYKLKKIAGSL